jgi:hypothetical protein
MLFGELLPGQRGRPLDQIPGQCCAAADDQRDLDALCAVHRSRVRC